MRFFHLFALSTGVPLYGIIHVRGLRAAVDAASLSLLRTSMAARNQSAVSEAKLHGESMGVCSRAAHRQKDNVCVYV